MSCEAPNLWLRGEADNQQTSKDCWLLLVPYNHHLFLPPFWAIMNHDQTMLNHPKPRLLSKLPLVLVACNVLVFPTHQDSRVDEPLVEPKPPLRQMRNTSELQPLCQKLTEAPRVATSSIWRRWMTFETHGSPQMVPYGPANDVACVHGYQDLASQKASKSQGEDMQCKVNIPSKTFPGSFLVV